LNSCKRKKTAVVTIQFIVQIWFYFWVMIKKWFTLFTKHHNKTRILMFTWKEMTMKQWFIKQNNRKKSCYQKITSFNINADCHKFVDILIQKGKTNLLQTKNKFIYLQHCQQHEWIFINVAILSCLCCRLMSGCRVVVAAEGRTTFHYLKTIL
jgi:hypothetical protein